MILKLKRFAGSGKSVFMVGGRSSSVKSDSSGKKNEAELGGCGRSFPSWGCLTLLHSNLGGRSLRLLFRCRLFILLDSPDLL